MIYFVRKVTTKVTQNKHACTVSLLKSSTLYKVFPSTIPSMLCNSGRLEETMTPVYLCSGVYRHHVGSSTSRAPAGSWLNTLRHVHKCDTFECFEEHDECLGNARLGAHVRVSFFSEVGKLVPRVLRGCCFYTPGTYVVPVCRQPTRGVHVVKLKSQCPAVLDTSAPVDAFVTLSLCKLRVRHCARKLFSCF